MSTCISKEVSCPVCGAVNKKQMWAGIDAQANPELRLRILRETLFDWKCPACGYDAQLVYPCLYHDKQRRFFICAAPAGCGGQKVIENVAAKYPHTVSVKKRVVGSLCEMKEKILLFEAGLDDVPAEVVKFALAELVEKKRGRKVRSGFFCAAGKDEDYIGFTFFLEGSDQPITQGTRLSVYNEALKIVQSTGFREDGSFLRVDRALAERLLEEYQE